MNTGADVCVKKREADIATAAGTAGSIMRPVSSLGGVFKRMGRSLPLIERVYGDLLVTDYSDSAINGFLVTGADRIRVRIEPHVKGPFPVLLRQVVECEAEEGSMRKLLRAFTPGMLPATPIANIPVWVSGRAWVEQEGVIVLLVRLFGFRMEDKS